jgi:hypothetical protein
LPRGTGTSTQGQLGWAGKVNRSIDACVVALIEAVRTNGFDSMRAEERRYLAALLRYIAQMADPDTPAPEGSDFGAPPAN